MLQERLTKSKRFNEIFHILLEHNFAGILRELAIYANKGPSPPVLATNGAKAAPSLPFRVRRMMEDLGPTFIKIGQLLGTRPDLIPNDFIEEFKKMYDQTQPTPFPEIRVAVEDQLGKPIEQVFASFEQTPLASASIAQVHRASLKSGERVAVKVQHPGIDERMRTDFEILKGIAAFTEKVFRASHVWQPVKHLEEVRHMLSKELDFHNELRTMQIVEENFRDQPEVKIPHPHLELSGKRVLVMEFVEGIKFRGRNQPELRNVDRHQLARTISYAMGKQIFVDRLFHADPSPGNILLLGSERVCFLDFGAVGQVTKRRAKVMLEFLLALRADNLDELARVVLELVEQHREYDPKKFLYDLERILEYYHVERASPADPVLLQKLIDLSKNHGMVLPSDFMLITRAIYQFEGMCRELDENYDLVEVLGPYVSRMLKERFFNPEVQAENLSNAAAELGKFVARLPGRVEKILLKLEKGELTSQMEIRGLEEYKRHRATLVVLAGFAALLAAWVLGIVGAYAFRGMEGFAVAVFVGLLALLVWAFAVIVATGFGRRR